MASKYLEMTMIPCRVCKKTMDRSEFSEANLRAYNNICRPCMRQKTIEHGRTFKGLMLAAYGKFRHSAKRDGAKVHFSREEFLTWGHHNDKLNIQYDQWVGFKYKKILRPSFCRLDAKKGFHLENITVKPLRELYITFGLTRSKMVDQMDLDGRYLATYPNAATAARYINGSSGDIRMCAMGERLTHMGYKWSYTQ